MHCGSNNSKIHDCVLLHYGFYHSCNLAATWAVGVDLIPSDGIVVSSLLANIVVYSSQHASPTPHFQQFTNVAEIRCIDSVTDSKLQHTQYIPTVASIYVSGIVQLQCWNVVVVQGRTVL